MATTIMSGVRKERRKVIIYLNGYICLGRRACWEGILTEILSMALLEVPNQACQVTRQFLCECGEAGSH
jgi:hypothetical protein